MGKGPHDVCLVGDLADGECSLDLIREIAGQDGDLPIIALPRESSRKFEQQAVEAGASDCLTKDELSAPYLARVVQYVIDKQRLETQLVTLTRYDPVTDLVNRSYFRTRLQESLAHARRSGRMSAILLLNLDDFKDINDSLGTAAGDRLLKTVSQRLAICARETDTVAHLGGDEFAIIATHLSHADDAAQLARKLIEALEAPVRLNGHEVCAKASIGITVYPLDDDEPEGLLKNAELALTQTKSGRRGGYQFYDAEVNTRVRQRKELEKDLDRGLQESEFFLEFQPKVDTVSGALAGAEALLRWHHPERGLISPGEFIPVAEDTGQIVALGDWVLREVCGQIASWRDAGLPPITVAVNLSAAQFDKADLVAEVMAVIDDARIDPASLELEITESMLMDDVDLVTDRLRQFHNNGLQLSIDDFGTGYSSLAYLTQFPVHKLKIDRAFVSQLGKDASIASIAKAIITLGKNLDLVVIAEGVETSAQLGFLKRQQCEQVQGFYFSRPLPAHQFVAWHQANRGTFVRPLNGRSMPTVDRLSAPRPVAGVAAA
jgi:diguanylate cyclase (GGDEF)-like protein